jgi:nicotinamide riboside transporter PnuC
MKDLKMKILEISIMVTSLIGSVLMSYGMFEGFIFFGIANVIGVYFFWKSNMKYMVIMQFVFGLTSINGIVRNLL